MNIDEQEFIQRHINAIRVAMNEINRSIGELHSYIYYQCKQVKALSNRLDKVEVVTDDVKNFCNMVEEEDRQYSKLRR